MAASLDSQDARFDARGSLILSPGNRRTAGTLPDITTGASQLVPSRTLRRTDNGVLIQEIGRAHV